MASLQIGFHPMAPTTTRLKCLRPLAASPDSADVPLDGDAGAGADPVKLAFARAEAYRRQKLQAQSQRLQRSSLSAKPQTYASEDKPPAATIIVGDPTKFGNRRRTFEEPEKDGQIEPYGTTVVEAENDGGTTYAPKVKDPREDAQTEAYRPKVKSWGVFPRPSNISEAYGGGKVIRPGDILETKEAREAKEKRTRELVAAYRKKMGLDVDPKLIAECQKYLREGNELMDKGNLRQALPFYEKVMKDMVFESELHGRAALQSAFCLDSLQRSSEAKDMYEKLQNHPNSEVSTKARHFAFSFKAMEFMKVRSSYLSRTTGYEMYFDSFVDNKEAYTSAKAEPKEAERRCAVLNVDLLGNVEFKSEPFR